MYVPIAPPQRTKMGPQRRLGIYVGYDSPSIINYIEPMTGDMFKARFADCHFNEAIFPALGGDKVDPNRKEIEITWNATQFQFLDPRANSCEQEVKKIIHLQGIANQLPDAFTDTKKVTKSHIPAENAPVRIDVPSNEKADENESIARRKRGRPFGSKDSKPRKLKKQDDPTNGTDTITPVENLEMENGDNDTPKDEENIDNNEKNKLCFSMETME